ncbi:uncharacterized protein LOC132574313, partial [Heteronotia binoei]|uniref:uncharacterized protein LOC132574313 n=1 Tax=Heteronotia binoei TaxID=13085 RepID=UPI00292F2563
ETFDPANPEAWESYAERVEFYLRANKVTDACSKRDVLLSICGPATFEIAKGLSAPARLTEKSYEEIIRLLTGHFSPQPSRVARRFLFHRRDQAVGESAADYLAALCKIAGNCNFPQLEDTLADRFTWGLRDERLQQKLFAKEELTLQSAFSEAGCLLWGSRVVVPPPLQKRVLESLHETHPGIVRMKALARSYVWWPGMDGEIETWVRRCQTCQESRPAPPSAPATRWESTRKPWSRLHIDFAGPFQGQIFMIIVDAYSKWLEVIPVGSTSAAAAIKALRRVLCTHGIPDTIVSDNGTAFTAADFQGFLNRAAFLFDNRVTPNPATGVSPAELLMGRKLITRLDRLHSSSCARGAESLDELLLSCSSWDLSAHWFSCRHEQR